MGGGVGIWGLGFRVVEGGLGWFAVWAVRLTQRCRIWALGTLVGIRVYRILLSNPKSLNHHPLSAPSVWHLLPHLDDSVVSMGRERPRQGRFKV